MAMIEAVKTIRKDERFVIVEISKTIDISILAPNAKISDFICLDRSSDGSFRTEKDGVVGILSTKDKKVEFIFLAWFKSG